MAMGSDELKNKITAKYIEQKVDFNLESTGRLYLNSKEVAVLVKDDIKLDKVDSDLLRQIRVIFKELPQARKVSLINSNWIITHSEYNPRKRQRIINKKRFLSIEFLGLMISVVSVILAIIFNCLNSTDIKEVVNQTDQIIEEQIKTNTKINKIENNLDSILNSAFMNYILSDNEIDERIWNERNREYLLQIIKVHSTGNIAGNLVDSIDVALHNTSAFLFCMGNEMFLKHQLDSAVIYYRLADLVDPNNYKIHNNWANSLQLIHKIENSFYHYNKSIELRYNNEFAWFNLGIHYYKKDSLVRSKESFVKALDLNKENKIAEKAIELLDKVIDKKKSLKESSKKDELDNNDKQESTNDKQESTNDKQESTNEKQESTNDLSSTENIYVYKIVAKADPNYDMTQEEIIEAKKRNYVFEKLDIESESIKFDFILEGNQMKYESKISKSYTYEHETSGEIELARIDLIADNLWILVSPKYSQQYFPGCIIYEFIFDDVVFKTSEYIANLQPNPEEIYDYLYSYNFKSELVSSAGDTMKVLNGKIKYDTKRDKRYTGYIKGSFNNEEFIYYYGYNNRPSINDTTITIEKSAPLKYGSGLDKSLIYFSDKIENKNNEFENVLFAIIKFDKNNDYSIYAADGENINLNINTFTNNELKGTFEGWFLNLPSRNDSIYISEGKFEIFFTDY